MRWLFLFAFLIFMKTGSAQLVSVNPEPEQFVSFGLGPGWVAKTPGMYIEGTYQQMLGRHVFTSVTFQLNAVYSGFRNRSVSLTSNPFPEVDQHIRHLAGMNVNIGYRFFDGPHRMLMQAGPGLYYYTDMSTVKAGNQVNLEHNSTVTAGFETSLGYLYEINESITTGMKAHVMFSWETQQAAIVLLLHKGF